MKYDQYDTKAHPTNKNKGNFYEETKKATEKYFEKRAEQGNEGLYDVRHLGAIKSKLRKGYDINKVKSRDWYDDLITGWRPPVNPKTIGKAPKVVPKKVDDESDAKFDINSYKPSE